MVTSIPKLTVTVFCFILLQSTVNCQNSRSYDENEWIPVSRPHINNANQNFPQLHAVHGKAIKPSELQNKYQDIQGQVPPRPNFREERIPNNQQVLLSPPLPQALPLVQELPHLQRQVPFVARVKFDDTKPQASQFNSQQVVQNNGQRTEIYQQVPQNNQPRAEVYQQVPQNNQPREQIYQQVPQNNAPRAEVYQQVPQNRPRAEAFQQIPENFPRAEALTGNPPQEKEEIQLLYVPLETLRQREQRQRFQDHSTAQSQSQVKFEQQNAVPQNQKQNRLKEIERDFIQQAVQAHKLQQQFTEFPQEYQQEVYQSVEPLQYSNQPNFILEAPLPPSTTPAPVKKRKPHQPPLAVYMALDGHQDVNIDDVLDVLKDAKSITVQDYVSEDSPKVFVGPSNLEPPRGFVKFILPYLSSFDKQKRERLHKESIPFFVAPLNYKTPPGYSKIPFPSPHVGSVVVSQRNDTPKIKNHPNLLSDEQLNEKTSQILYSEASTVASNNKNRQAYSPVPVQFPGPTASSFQYEPVQQFYQNPRPVASTQIPVSSTTQRPFFSSFEPQLISGPIFEQFPQGHRFTTVAPQTETATYPTQAYSVTKQPSRHNQRPQVSLSTPDDSYYDTTRTKTPTRYVPEVQRQQVSTTRQYLEQTTPRSSFQSSTSKLTGFEAVKNLSQENSQNDQVYTPTYQETPQPQYEIRTERPRQKEVSSPAPKVVSENSYNSNQFQVQHVTAQQVLEDIREKERPQINNQPNTQYVLSQDQVYQIPQQNHRFVFKQETPVTTEQQKVEYVPTIPQQHANHNYKLPTDLPINPQLPSLVNSLEDQAIRPLLAPLLLPTAEEGEVQNYLENTSQTVASHEETSSEVVTQEPQVETTTPYRRLRGRQRGTRPTNTPVNSSRTRTHSSGSRTATQNRRPEQKEVIDSSTRSTVRSRYTSRERQQHPVSTTENIPENNLSHKRFRTRGRPVKPDEVFSVNPERTTEHVVAVEPSTQSLDNVYVSSAETSTEDERKYVTQYQNDQPLTYLINGQHLLPQNVQGGEEQTIYVLKEQPQVPQEVKTERVQVIQEVPEPTTKETPRVTSVEQQSQYLVESKPRTRARTRARRPSTTTTTEAPTTRVQESKESEEFYGFFRQPNFKPKMEYKSSAEMRSTHSPIHVTTDTPQYHEEQGPIYVSNARSSTPRVYQIQTEVPAVSAESYEDVKPVTIRTTPLRRRPTTPSSQEITSSPEKIYSSRTKTSSRTSQDQSTAVKRVRTRVRRPTTPRAETSSEEVSRNPIPARTRTRGKSHYQRPKQEEREEEEENYPAGFLKAQGTPRPSFRLTVEPDSSEEQEGAYSTHPKPKGSEIVHGEESQRYEKTVESPNSIEKVEKTTKPLDNVDISDDFYDSTSPITEKLIDTTTTAAPTTTTETTSTEEVNTENSTEDLQKSTETSTEEETTSYEVDDTTNPPTTTEEISKTTKKARRRGVWKLVAHRPIDMFQSAESQNVGTVLANDVSDNQDIYKINKNKVAAMLTGQSLEEIEESNKETETAQPEIPETTSTKPQEDVPSTESVIQTEPSIDIFDEVTTTEIPTEDYDQIAEEQENDSSVMSFFDQFLSSLENSTPKSKKTISKYDEYKSKIIGTSTTTEVSHETEICYKGRCVKSN